MRLAFRCALQGAVALGLFACVGSTPAAGATAAPSQNIADYVAKLQDFSATVHILDHNDRAGARINKDFSMIYQLHGDVAARYKEENKLRLDGRLGASKVTFIMNGSRQYVRLPSLGIRKVDSLGDSPGKRKTLLDVGLISRGYLAYTEAKFIGIRPAAGVMCAEFEISYRAKELDTSHRLVWIDPKTRITVKREEYSQEGKLNATFYYKDPVEVSPGIWFPTRIQALNDEGQMAGETAYRNISVNVGLPDSLFSF